MSALDGHQARALGAALKALDTVATNSGATFVGFVALPPAGGMSGPANPVRMVVEWREEAMSHLATEVTSTTQVIRQ